MRTCRARRVRLSWVQTRLSIVVFAALLVVPTSMHATTAKSPHNSKLTETRHGSTEAKAVSKHRKSKRHAKARTAPAAKSATNVATAKQHVKHGPAAEHDKQAHRSPSASHPTKLAAAHRHLKHARKATHRGHRQAQQLAARRRDPAKLILPQGDGSPVLDVAARYLGQPYRFGAQAGAFDCSGFVRTVFANMGVELPHSARAQSTFGDRIERDELEPGDLVFFRNTRRHSVSHVGIYVGDDKFVHAAARGGQIQVDSLNEAYFATRYCGARRIEI